MKRSTFISYSTFFPSHGEKAIHLGISLLIEFVLLFEICACMYACVRVQAFSAYIVECVSKAHTIVLERIVNSIKTIVEVNAVASTVK